jgi:predicted acetyltransferase
MAVSIEHLRPGDEPARLELGGQAFGSRRPYDPAWETPGDDVIAAYEGDRLIGAAAMMPGGQWFGGRPVPGPGVSGVSVAPDRRGRGLARALMTELLAVASARGAAISTLYPTTAALYRSVGYEIAGDHVERSLPVEALQGRRRDSVAVDVEAFTADALDRLAPAYDALASLTPGSIVRGDRWWWHRRRLLARSDDEQYLLRVDHGGAAGYVVARATQSDRRILDLVVDDVGAASPEVLAALGGVLAGFGTVAGLVRSHLAPWILQAMTTEGQRWNAGESFGWMLRIVDLERAFAARGWAPVEGSVDLDITDDTGLAPSGPWRLVAGGGTVTVEPGGAGTWRIGIGDLASWYSGWLSASQLAHRGLLRTDDGSAADLALLDALAAGLSPVLGEFF